ncbi:MAG: zinc ribbon domain-containing protein [Candidatus Thermoplasmatota archaeon]
MARGRWGFILLSVISLVVLVSAGVLTAFSVTVTPDMERATRLPGAADPVAGMRALVVPIAAPTLVPTFLQPAPDAGAPEGALLLVADPGTSFPAQSRNASIVHALAFVAPTANGSFVPQTLTFTDLTHVEGNATIAENVTVDVNALAVGQTGFIVKAETERNITFVPTDHVVGTVAQYDPAPLIPSLFVLGGAGFVGPIIVLIVTHRGRAVSGVGSVTAGLCRECRAPLDAGSTFCTHCGAWQDGKGSP